MAGYSAALAEAQRHGGAGRIIPSGRGRNITYRFMPSGPAPGRTGGSSITPAAGQAFSKAIAQYQPGGSFDKGVEAKLARSRTKSMASGMQSLVGSGLAGTTMAAGLGKKFDEEVGMPTLAGVEEARAGNLSRLYASLAGMEQSGFESAQSRMPRFTGGGGGGGGGMAGARNSNPYIRSLLPSGSFFRQGATAGPAKTGGSQALLAEYETV
ncbi:hypothetical protein LCGC14_0356310 [marine sediment metagenome]|uniref:Uncharacterized protein n=1 Tax=marine sediment metagenome TaxID=412755 RepID=A0A0F9TF73_9ZZZZ